jgi:hypothetical protein
MQGNDNLEKFNQQKKPKKSRPDKVRQKKRGHPDHKKDKREDTLY